MKQWLITLTTLLTLSSTAKAQPTQTQVDTILNDAKAKIDALYVPAGGGVVSSGHLQVAVVAAASGTTLQLAPGYVDLDPVVLYKPITIRGAGQLKGGLTVTGSNITVDGPTISKLQQNNDIVVLSGSQILLQNLNIIGAPTGQKRGILGNARSLTIRNVRVTGIWLPDQDTQAFACWDGCQDVTIEDSYFSAAGETLLIGGADPTSATGIPRSITVRRTTLTKDLTWLRPGVQVKNTLELKCVDGFMIEDSIIENSWQSAQEGFLIVLTPRNQDGKAPFCGIKNVIIRNNTGGNAAGFVNISGRDDTGNLTTLLSDVQLLGNNMKGFDHAVWALSPADATHQLIQVGSGPARVTFDRNTLAGANIGSAVYFYDLPQLQAFIFTNNTYPRSTYGIFGADAAVGGAWQQYVATGTLSGNIEK